MKRVSFEVAKAIKEAGYPQELYYGVWYFADIDSINAIPFCGVPLKEVYWVVPTYLEVWLWLWREKNIYINTFLNEKGTLFSIWDSDLCGIYEDKIYYKCPEEAIIAAIEYLVTNDLIKRKVGKHTHILC